MSAPFQFTPQATEDLDAIWWFIAEDNRDAADRVEMEIIVTCRRLAKHPMIGTRRQDITRLPVRFWTVTKFPNYVIVYRPETAPLQVIAVLHVRGGGRRGQNGGPPFTKRSPRLSLFYDHFRTVLAVKGSLRRAQ